MRRILLCSDIHGCVCHYDQTIAEAGRIDAIMIAGDVGNYRVVQGKIKD